MCSTYMRDRRHQINHIKFRTGRTLIAFKNSSYVMEPSPVMSKRRNSKPTSCDVKNTPHVRRQSSNSRLSSFPLRLSSARLQARCRLPHDTKPRSNSCFRTLSRRTSKESAAVAISEHETRHAVIFRQACAATTRARDCNGFAYFNTWFSLDF